MMTNPEMVHLSFLAYYDNWKDWLYNLYLVSVDEAHIYRGIFGANVHHLFDRLKRLLPNKITWIGTSATIGQGKRFFEKLTGEKVVLIQKSGAPRPKRNLCLLQPKGSPYTLACYLMEKLIEQGKRTVTFTKARRITELIYNWLIKRNLEYKSIVSSYRAGFLPSERRVIEQKFFDGTKFFNLGERKVSDGIQSVKWFREGKIYLVEEYCKKDVELTGKLYLKAIKDGSILFKSKDGRT